MAYKDKNKERVARKRAKAKHYALHRETEQRKARERIRARRKRAYEYVDEIKATTPCADCRQTFDAICMDFDHCRGKKSANVSRLINVGKSLDQIKAEMDKCELVCANCHRIRTRDHAQWRGATSAEP